METKVRLWPAWVLIVVAAVVAGSVPFLATRQMIHFYGLIAGPIVATFGILGWWLTFSRVKGIWRWLPVLVFLIGLAAVWVVVYPGRKFIPLFVLAPPIAVGWIVWLTLTRPATWTFQLMGGLSIIVLGWAIAAFVVRVDGTDTEMVPELRWAWTPSNEELFERELAARRGKAAALGLSATVEIQPGDWPEFRGQMRNGISTSRIRSDWTVNPPKELWRHRVGPGWGSFAVVDGRLFTQEQRGEDEAVVCYHAATGTELWEARVPARFLEDISGVGPRATPTIYDDKVFAFGATGKLVALDAATGKQLWLHDVCHEYGVKPPQWGFASSPLVIAGNVIVFAAAPEKGTIAYHIDGTQAWANGRGLHGYSSPQSFQFDGKWYVLQVSDFGLEVFDPKSGEARGSYDWSIRGQNRVAQPAVINDRSILLGTPVGGSQGARSLLVEQNNNGNLEFKKNRNLEFTMHWTSRSPKPYFNDGVVFENHYYGWDDRNFVCVDLKNGKVKWNAGSGYGFGQVLLLPAQKLLLVQSENGTVRLLEANPEEQIEIAKLAALKDKTWNHPVVVRGKLYVRNGVEAACYDISEVGK